MVGSRRGPEAVGLLARDAGTERLDGPCQRFHGCERYPLTMALPIRSKTKPLQIVRRRRIGHAGIS